MVVSLLELVTESGDPQILHKDRSSTTLDSVELYLDDQSPPSQEIFGVSTLLEARRYSRTPSKLLELTYLLDQLLVMNAEPVAFLHSIQ